MNNCVVSEVSSRACGLETKGCEENHSEILRDFMDMIGKMPFEQLVNLWQGERARYAIGKKDIKILDGIRKEMEDAFVARHLT